MKKKLSKLERDFFEEVAQTPHDLWELFQYVRRHHPNVPESTALQIGRELISTWIARGWLRAFPEHGKLGTVMSGDEILTFIDKLGNQAMAPGRKTIRLDLTEHAYKDAQILWPKK